MNTMLFDESDLLWDELNLGGLVESMKIPDIANELETNERKSGKPLSDALIGHQKMLKKPSYNVLMDRYQSLPHKPKTIQKAKINRLADPVKGRYINFEKYMDVSPTTKNKHDLVDRQAHDDERHYDFDESRSPSASPLRKQQSQQSASNKAQSAFFLTENTDDNDDDDYQRGEYGSSRSPTSRSQADFNNKIEANKQSARNGFAAVLRNRIEEANKIEQLQKPLKIGSSAEKIDSYVSSRSQAAIDSQRQAKPSVTRRVPPTTSKRPAAVSKKAWQENTLVHHFKGSTNKKPIAQVVATTDGRRQPKAQPPRDDSKHRILSSGYGGPHAKKPKKGEATLVRLIYYYLL